MATFTVRPKERREENGSLFLTATRTPRRVKSAKSVKMKAAPKKYELVFDKLAVDYMVKAGYNPLGLITFINKSCPQVRQDTFSTKNLTSKRLANIYERIYTKYPAYLANNEYLYNDYYQNFLLTSQENRKKLEEKITSGNKKQVIKYD